MNAKQEITAWGLIVWTYRDQKVHRAGRKDRVGSLSRIPLAGAEEFARLGVTIDTSMDLGWLAHNDAELVDDFLRRQGPALIEIIRLASQGLSPTWKPDMAHLPLNCDDPLYVRPDFVDPDERDLALINAGRLYYDGIRKTVRELQQFFKLDPTRLTRHRVKGCGLQRLPKSISLNEIKGIDFIDAEKT